MTLNKQQSIKASTFTINKHALSDQRGADKKKNQETPPTAITTLFSSTPIAYYSLLTHQLTKPVSTTKRAEYAPNKPPPEEPWL